MLICLSNHVRMPAKSWAERIEDAYGEIETALRDALGTDAPARVKFRDKPLSGHDLNETVSAIKDAQAEVTALAARWLKAPTKAALERLIGAREREADLLQVILGGKNPRMLDVLSGMSGRARGRPPSNGEVSKALDR
jgi:hypothetical protein